MDEALRERLERLKGLAHDRDARHALRRPVEPSEAPEAEFPYPGAPNLVVKETGEVLHQVPIDGLGASVDRDVTPVGMHHPETSYLAADRAKPKSGAWRRRYYDRIASLPEGATDDEMEIWSERPHQSSSSTMSGLRGDGLLIPLPSPEGGKTYRNTRLGNPAVVWTVVPEGKP